MSYNCKNYMTDGGDTLVIGGKLSVAEGATIEGMASATTAPATSSTLGLVKVGANVDVSAQGAISVKTASTSNKGVVKQGVAVADAEGDAPTAAEFKALLDSLRGAGVIATAE